jgi:FkbM family methyltransferase
VNLIERRLGRSPNYLRRFGFWSGIRLLLQIERSLSPRSDRVREIILEDGRTSVHLRDSVADHAIFWQCLVRNQYAIDQFPQAERLMAAYEGMLASGKTPIIIDCGANIGLASFWFHGRFPKARIFAVEPDTENFAMVERNTAHLDGKVTCLLGGVWSEPGWLRIENPETESADFQVARVEEGAPGAIRGYSIDEIMKMAGASEILICKIDIEGAQAKLFERNTEWVERTHLVTLELEDWLMPWSGSSRPFFKCRANLPFDYLVGGENIFCFRDFCASRKDGA